MANPHKKKQPVRLSYLAAVICSLGFASFAAWPYLTRAAERVTEGKTVSVSEVQKDVNASEKDSKKKMEKDKPFEPKSITIQPDGSILVGGKAGLKELRDGKLVDVPNFGGMDVRGLTVHQDSTWAAAKDGLWKKDGNEWKNIKQGDFHAVTFDRDGSILAAGKTGVWRSTSGSDWELVKGTETGEKPDHD
jgi:hypothetical protein